MNMTKMRPLAARFGRALFRLTKSVAIIYIGVLLVLMFFENLLVYRPMLAAQGWEPAPPGVVDIPLTADDGTALHAWWTTYPGATSALLYLHGNAGNLSHRGSMLVKLRDSQKCNVLIVDYPGYGKSGGRASEAGCYAAAQAAYDWLVDDRKTDPKQIILFGKSLGGGVAVELASRVEHRALVLVKTFSSMPAVGSNLYPWLPVRWIMRNRFDSLERINLCRSPIFVAGAEADQLVPFAHAQCLYEACAGPRAFFRIPGGHNDALPEEFFKELKTFLDETSTHVAEPRPSGSGADLCIGQPGKAVEPS